MCRKWIVGNGAGGVALSEELPKGTRGLWAWPAITSQAFSFPPTLTPAAPPPGPGEGVLRGGRSSCAAPLLTHSQNLAACSLTSHLWPHAGLGVTAENVTPTPFVFCEGDHRSTLTCISPDGNITVHWSGCSPAIMSGILAADLERRVLVPRAGFRANVIRHTFCFRIWLFRAWLPQPSSSSFWPWFTVKVDTVICFSS